MGFDPRYRFFLEETDLNFRLAERESRIAIAPLAQVHHGFEPSDRRRQGRGPTDLSEFKVSEHPPEGWDKTRTWENRRTQKVRQVPVGIDPGFDRNVGQIEANQEAANRPISRIDTAPPDLARASIGEPWNGTAFKRFIDLAEKQSAADRVAKDAPGDWPVAVIGEDVPEATEGKSRALRLSAGTAWKQTRHHPEFGHETYALVQNILDEGELFSAGRERHFIAFLEIDGKLWRAVFKVTSDRDETFLVSPHRTKARDVALASRDLTRLDRNAGWRWHRAGRRPRARPEA